MTQSEGEKYLTTKEAVDYLDVSATTFVRLVNRNNLTKYKQEISQEILYSQSELDELKKVRPFVPAKTKRGRPKKKRDNDNAE